MGIATGSLRVLAAVLALGLAAAPAAPGQTSGSDVAPPAAGANASSPSTNTTNPAGGTTRNPAGSSTTDPAGTTMTSPAGGTTAPSTGAATPPAGTTPAAPGAATPDPAATQPGPATGQQPEASAGTPATTAAPASAPSGSSSRVTTAAVLLAMLGAVLLLGALAYGVARWRAWEPAWWPRVRHASSEAGWRASATWAEFTDWLRLGR